MKETFVLLLFLISLFLHEAFYFYLPFLLAIHYLKTKKMKYPYFIFFVGSSTIILLLFYFYGLEINHGKSIEIIKNRGITLSYFNVFTHHPVFLKEQLISYILFVCELFLVIVQFAYYLYYFNKKHFKNFILFNICSIIFVAPLFYLAVDWFRWIHMYSMLLVLLAILLLPNRKKHEELFNGNRALKEIIFTTLFLFIIFFVHVQYDASGGSMENTKQHYLRKITDVFKN